MADEIISSKKVVRRNIKILIWGNTGTRKTEFVLRNFPKVLCIDTEGNADQCADNPEIPEFLLAKTKDPRKIVELIDKVATGKIKFEDGSLVETVCVDTITVPWSVQQEFANLNAEKRALKYGNKAEESNATPLDWGLAKRPMKAITNRLSNSPVKYLVMISREKDLYEEKKEGQSSNSQSKKIGDQPDVVKGLTYEVNLGLHFMVKDGVWSYETTKVQGTLGQHFQAGKIGTKFPFKELFAFTSVTKQSVAVDKDDVQIAEEQVKETNAPARAKTFDSLKEYAISLGIPVEKFGEALKSGGWTEYKPSVHEIMEAYLQEYSAR